MDRCCNFIGNEIQYVRPKTGMVKMTYAEWLEKAKASLTQNKIDVEHFYLQMGTGPQYAFVIFFTCVVSYGSCCLN